MRVARIVLIYIALFTAGGFVMLALQRLPFFATQSFLRTIFFCGVILPIIDTVGRQLTGWPPHRLFWASPKAMRIPLPIHGSADGAWSVIIDEPGPDSFALGQYLSTSHGVRNSAAMASLAVDHIPLLVAQAMTEKEAVTLANDLRDRGATASVQEEHA